MASGESNKSSGLFSLTGDTKQNKNTKSNSLFDFVKSSRGSQGKKISDVVKEKDTSSSNTSIMDKIGMSSSEPTSKKTEYDTTSTAPIVKPDKMDKESLTGRSGIWNQLTHSNRLWIKIVLVVLLLAFLGVNVLFYLGFSLKKIGGELKNWIMQILHLLQGKTKKKPPPPSKKNPIKKMKDAVEDPKKRMSPKKRVRIVEPDVDTIKVHTSGKSGYCNVGSWKGIRSCVKVNSKNDCMSGDIFPTKDICINPTLRQ